MNEAKVSEFIVHWIKEYAVNANVKGLVIGVSGGIDSALTSTLCAMTGLPTLCVEMPIHQSKNQVTKAQEHIDQLKNNFTNVTSIKVDLTSIFDGFKEVVSFR